MRAYTENFSEGEHLPTIREEGKIYTACGDGKIPFISAIDIAAVVVRVLLDEEPHNRDYRLLGSQLLTHDEVRCSRGSQLRIESNSCTDCGETE